MNKEEIDRLIAEEVSETTGNMTTIDDFNNRRMTCKFFGHARTKKVDKYKGAYTSFCPYCAEIISYRTLNEFKRPTGPRIFPDTPTMFFEYMLSDEFKEAKHPEDKK